MTIKSVIATMAMAVGMACFAADPLDSQDTVEVGKWCNDFPAALEYAENNNIPLLVFYAKDGCGMCKKLEAAVLESDFLEWQAQRKIVMMFAFGKSTASGKKANEWVKEYMKSNELPFIGVYWKSNTVGKVVRASFVGRKSKMPVTKGTLQEQLMGSVDQLIAGWDPSGVTPSPTPTPTPVEKDVRSEAYGATRKLSAVVFKNDFVNGTAAITLGKLKSGTVKVTARISTFDGKSYSANKTVTVAKNGSADDTLTFKSPLGAIRFALSYTNKVCVFTGYNALYEVGSVDGQIGGVLDTLSLSFAASTDFAALFPTGYDIIAEAYPTNEVFTVDNGTKWKFGKTPTLKYVKSDGEYVLTGLTDAKKPNVSGLKLTYKKDTGVFSGSFKIYATNANTVAAGKKPTIKKFTASVKGIVIDGVGYGLFTVKINKITYSPTCTIE